MIYKVYNYKYYNYKMTFPIFQICFSCGSRAPAAINIQYCKLQQEELTTSGLTSKGAAPKEDSKCMKLLKDADITNQCCLRMIYGAVNYQEDLSK